MWKVILLFDTSGAASRRTIQGIARYSSLHGPWVFFREPPFYMVSNGKLKTIKKLPDLGDQKADGIIAHIAYTRNGSQFIPNGIPAIVRHAIKKVMWVIGKYFLKPPISFI